MAVAIMQPYFFPYLGYFQLVQAVDHFVFYDDVMFIKKGWINRNRILMQGNEFLFTIPLEKQSQNKTIQITQNEIRQILITQKPGVLDEDTQRRLRNYRDQVLSKTVDFGDLAKNSPRIRIPLLNKVILDGFPPGNLYQNLMLL